MTHPQPRMPAFLDIARRAAESEDQKVAQPLFGSGEVIVFRVQGAEDVIPGNAAIEGSDQFFEAFFADDRINIALVH